MKNIKLKKTTYIRWVLNVACFGLMGILQDIYEWRTIYIINKWVYEDPELIMRKLNKSRKFRELPDEVKEYVDGVLTGVRAGIAASQEDSGE